MVKLYAHIVRLLNKVIMGGAVKEKENLKRKKSKNGIHNLNGNILALNGLQLQAEIKKTGKM
jgi:hypothetical protein